MNHRASLKEQPSFNLHLHCKEWKCQPLLLPFIAVYAKWLAQFANIQKRLHLCSPPNRYVAAYAITFFFVARMCSETSINMRRPWFIVIEFKHAICDLSRNYNLKLAKKATKISKWRELAVKPSYFSCSIRLLYLSQLLLNTAYLLLKIEFLILLSMCTLFYVYY